MDVDEATLVAQAVGGDRDALSVLLERHGPGVAQQLSFQLPPVHRAVLDPEDVMQVTYLEAFLSIGRFVAKGSDAFTVWLTRIAVNNLRDAIRELERQKRPPASLRVVAVGSESGPAALLDRVGWTSTTPSRCVNNEEMQAKLLETLDRLPADYARVVRLYDLEGRRPADVAVMMQRSVGAVHMLRARALDRLRELLGGIAGPVTD